MPGGMKVDGIEEISKALARLGDEAGAVAARALYYGAGIVANEISAAVDDLETEKFRIADDSNPRKCSPLEKAALRGRMSGIAKFDREGAEVSTSVGLKNAGYAMLAGREVPLPLLARSINSGTTFRVKQPFFRKAVNKARGVASQRIADEVGKAVEKLFGNFQE